MAANKVVHFALYAFTNAIANILNPGTTTGGTGMPSNSGNLYYIVRHIRLVNKTSSAVTVSMYVGATGGSAAGTEFLGTALSIAANSAYDWYGMLRLDASDYLTGLASANTAITFEAEGEIGVN